MKRGLFPAHQPFAWLRVGWQYLADNPIETQGMVILPAVTHQGIANSTGQSGLDATWLEDDVLRARMTLVRQWW